MAQGRSNKVLSKNIALGLYTVTMIPLIAPIAAQSIDSTTQPSAGYTLTQSTTDINVPQYALDQLVCDIDNATCQNLGPDFGHTPDYLKVCFEQYDDNGDPTNNFYSCKPLCEKYHYEEVGETYRRDCDNPDNCPEYVDHCLGVGPTQPPTEPPRDIPYSPEECCNADDEICQSDTALLENCSDMCYPDHVSQGVFQGAACKPICTSDDHIKLEKCDNECPNYVNLCGIGEPTPQPTKPPRDIPYSLAECCNADDEICQSDTALLENCSDMCYPDHVSQGVFQGAACKPICTSEDHIKLEKCDNECPNYNNSCRRYIVTVRPSTGYEEEGIRKKLPDVKLIVGITVAVIFSVVIAITVSVVLYNKNRNSGNQSGDSPSPSEELSLTSITTASDKNQE